jgi:hypothetical protein
MAVVTLFYLMAGWTGDDRTIICCRVGDREQYYCSVWSPGFERISVVGGWAWTTKLCFCVERPLREKMKSNMADEASSISCLAFGTRRWKTRRCDAMRLEVATSTWLGLVGAEEARVSRSVEVLCLEWSGFRCDVLLFILS